MPEMSMKQAADWAGVSKPTISKALNSGRLSGTKDDNGQWSINPAELERVFGPASSRNGADTVAVVDSDTPTDREMALLREMVTRAERVADDLRDERDRLLTVIERQSLLLVDQREKAGTTPAIITPAPIAASAGASARPGLFARLKAAISPAATA